MDNNYPIKRVGDNGNMQPSIGSKPSSQRPQNSKPQRSSPQPQRTQSSTQAKSPYFTVEFAKTAEPKPIQKTAISVPNQTAKVEEKKPATPLVQEVKKEEPKKEEVKHKVRIPYQLRFPIAFTLFAIILGILIQSIKLGEFSFFGFFGIHYIDWFRSFGSFTDPTIYSSTTALITTILKDWYYFLYTGGLISLIWGLIFGGINREV